MVRISISIFILFYKLKINHSYFQQSFYLHFLRNLHYQTDSNVIRTSI